MYASCTDVQEYAGKLKVVKVEHDKNPKLIEKYKVSVTGCRLWNS
jgi:hypothetical protein